MLRVATECVCVCVCAFELFQSIMNHKLKIGLLIYFKFWCHILWTWAVHT